MNYIDIHSHILPGLDDGAGSEAESLEMFRIAAKDGISEIIATPHFHYRRGHATPEQIGQAIQNMQKKLKAAGIQIKIHAGNELHYSHELINAVKAGEALTLAGSDYVLLEFSPEAEKRKIQNALYQFLSEGYYPIIAHVERYGAFLSDLEFALEISEMGAYYQVNTGSLLGKSGWKTKRFVKTLIKGGLVQFVASDAHDIEKRRPEIKKAAAWIERHCSQDALYEYLYKNPRLILETNESEYTE